MLSNPLVWLVSYFFIKLLSIKVSCYDISNLFEQFLHDLFPDHMMMEGATDGNNLESIAGNQNTTCGGNRQIVVVVVVIVVV